MSERASQINLARVYMAQARATPHRSFAFTLIEWAGAARRRAMATGRLPEQAELF